MSPAVTVAVEDTRGNTVTANTSTVTLTLSSGTFASGTSTATASTVNGVATFSTLAINTAGTYTVAASDGSLTAATSGSFTISAATSISINFNTGAASFTGNFKVYNNGGAEQRHLAWGAAFGVEDQPGPAAGGGVESSGSVSIDSTAVYTPSKVNLSDGKVHTISEYVTAVSGLGTGDKPLQIGWLAPTSTGFNAGFSFISARILGNNTVEFQYDNGGTAHFDRQHQADRDHQYRRLARPGLHGPGDGVRELQGDVFAGRLRPDRRRRRDDRPGGSSCTITGLTNLGTASAVSPGFRTQTPASFTGHVRYNNFTDPVSPSQAGTPVSLAGSFNQVGIVADGSTFSGGLDGGGAALSGNLLGTSHTWNDTAFTLGTWAATTSWRRPARRSTCPPGALPRCNSWPRP